MKYPTRHYELPLKSDDDSDWEEVSAGERLRYLHWAERVACWNEAKPSLDWDRLADQFLGDLTIDAIVSMLWDRGLVVSFSLIDRAEEERHRTDHRAEDQPVEATILPPA